MSLSDRWRLELNRLEHDGRRRALQAPAGIDFSSNDYLGYSKRTWPAVELDGLPIRSTGSDLPRSGTASRLLSGHRAIWDDVETKLAAWHQAEAALVMTSGYAANEGLLSTVIESGDLVFSDQCNHASIIDGLRLSRAEKILFSHNDLNELETLMRQRKPGRSVRQTWFVVTESLFGMEGDASPLREMADMAERYQAHLIVDEAHATGCFGPAGSGLVDALRLRYRILASIHTGGKALAVPGAYIVGSRLLREMLVNRCRHFIFTTALPPQVGSWWLDALALAATDEKTRRTLHERARFFRKELALQRIGIGGSHYIATVMLGMDGAAIEAARQLQEAGYDIRAIRPPTVPPGTARLRISIHADHEQGVLLELAKTLATLVPPSL
jgi:8-amino-7-oxononanoate synthase